MTGAWSVCRASPSLALLKYWGKIPNADNLPATPSLAVTLGGLHTDTSVRVSQSDSVSVRGVLQDSGRYEQFFDSLRSRLGVSLRFEARSLNSFPTAAGLASSSSGFAALAGACVRSVGRKLSVDELSEIARIGSVSAARSVFGGFVLLPAGARSARQIFEPAHWPELRIVVAVTHGGRKPLPTREAMGDSVRSPYYGQWISESQALLPDALEALAARDLEKLGEAARASYSMMHAALLAARPPVLYWLPATLALIHGCHELRRRGVGAWETIDAGPQVKILCREGDAGLVTAGVKEWVPGIETYLCFPGEGLSVSFAEEPVQ